ncbi:MAG: hypothetical protein ACTSVI_11625 [Promethearchaeota archaeon]
MAKDKLIGALILVGSAALLVFYTIWLIGGWIHSHEGEVPSWLLMIPEIPGWGWTLAVVLPIWLVAILVLAIAMWIGYSMATTPPPVPLEELEAELEAEEAAEEAEKKEKN